MKLTRFEESCCSFNIPKELTRPVGDTWIVIVTHRWERWRIEEAEAGMLLKSTSQTQSRSVSQQYTIPDQKKEQVWTTHSCKFLCLRELHFNKIQHTCGARRRWGGGGLCIYMLVWKKNDDTHTLLTGPRVLSCYTTTFFSMEGANSLANYGG